MEGCKHVVENKNITTKKEAKRQMVLRRRYCGAPPRP